MLQLIKVQQAQHLHQAHTVVKKGALVSNSRGEEILLCSRLSLGRFKGVIQGSLALVGGLDPQQLLQYAHLWGLLLLQRFFGLQKEEDPEAEPTLNWI